MPSQTLARKQAAMVAELKKMAETKGVSLAEELRGIAASKGPDQFWAPCLDQGRAAGDSFSSRLSGWLDECGRTAPRQRRRSAP